MKFFILLSPLFFFAGCKYHSSMENYIASNTPSTKYKISESKHEFVKKVLPQSKLLQIQAHERKIIKSGLIRFPHELKYSFVEGKVELFIRVDQEGTPHIMETFSYNHEAFLSHAKKCISRTKFDKNDQDEYYFISIEYKNNYPFHVFVSYGKPLLKVFLSSE